MKMRKKKPSVSNIESSGATEAQIRPSLVWLEMPLPSPSSTPFNKTGRYTVEVVAIDVNGRTSQRKTHTIDVEAWQLQPDPARPGMHVLVVGGSDRDDRISLKPVYRQDEYVRLRINEVDYDIKRTQTVRPGVDSLLVLLKLATIESS